MTDSMTSPASTWVYDFAQGDRSQVDLLGGKGANLAEMTRMGLPVPPGFTITTEACRYFLEHGHGPEGMRTQIALAVARLEDEMGRKLGDPEYPLLVSVRSGARFSMPGMMETVLNIGLNDASVAGLARQSRLAARNVTVNAVAPGFIATPMTDVLNDKQKEMILGRVPAGKLGTPDDIAAAVLYLASDEANYVTGQTLHVNGGMAMI